MKKLFISMILVMGLMMLPMTAGATTFSLNDTALLMLWEVNENPVNTTTTLLAVTTDTVVYGASMSGDVGFTGLMFDSVVGNPHSPFAQMQIGANFWGAADYADDSGSHPDGTIDATGPTTAQVIGAALGTAPTNSLVGYSNFSLYLENDNDDDWSVNLFLNTGYTDWGETNNYYENGWVTLAGGSSAVLTVDLTGVANLNHLTNIGFNVGGDMGAGNPNPSNSDVFHVSAARVPEPSTMLLLGAGLIGLAGIGRRKFFKK